jgi:hypothetical protein
MRHETTRHGVPPAERVDFTLDTYESSSTRKVTFAAVVLGVAVIVFAAGYGARVVEERMVRAKGIRPEAVQPAEWRNP